MTASNVYRLFQFVWDHKLPQIDNRAELVLCFVNMPFCKNLQIP